MLTLLYQKYLKTQGESLLDGKSGKYIVLDLDLTLLKTFDEEDEKKLEENAALVQGDYSHIIYRIPQRKSGGKSSLFAAGVKRPELFQFLLFCHEYFEGVCVWSAGSDLYVKRIVEEVFKGLPKPFMVFSRSHCPTYKQNGDKYYYKPLEKMISQQPKGGKMSLENTIILDDTEETFRANKDNAILIPRYNVEPNLESIQKVDHMFLELINYFLQTKFLYANDVREVAKPNL